MCTATCTDFLIRVSSDVAGPSEVKKPRPGKSDGMRMLILADFTGRGFYCLPANHVHLVSFDSALKSEFDANVTDEVKLRPILWDARLDVVVIVQCLPP